MKKTVVYFVLAVIAILVYVLWNRGVKDDDGEIVVIDSVEEKK